MGAPPLHRRRRGRRRRRRRGRALRGADCRPRRRARRARLRDAARADRQLLGPGRPRGRARSPTTRPTSTGATPRSPAAARSAAAPRSCSAARRRAPSASSRRSASRFDADRHGGARARPRGRPLAPPRRPRRRQRHRPARRAPAQRGRRRGAAHRGPRAGARRGAVDRRRSLRRRRPARTAARSAPVRPMLATGGAAALWSRTTNPPGSLGIGLMLAHAAGAALADLEFVQFHPTAVTGVRGREGFLVTEAIRGEGATLLDAGGERFVDELAPRDEVVARRLSHDGRAGHQERLARHARRRPGAVPQRRRRAARVGARPGDRARSRSRPASHYCMGGVVADLDGASSVPGLYVVGETACTGLHGANRLASNSLTECFVLGRARRAGRPRRAALHVAPGAPAARRADRAAGRSRPARRSGATPA